MQKVIKYMDAYIATLVDKLNHVEFTGTTGRKIEEYSEGIKNIVKYFSDIKRAGSKAYFIGNGGSAAIADHMTADFMKNGGVATCNLYGTALTTCLGNDYGYEEVFSRPLSMLADEHDVLVAISSSGRSQNIINAIEVAKSKDVKVITFTGFDRDNPVSTLGDINVYVPCDKYGVVESIHNMMLQEVVDLLMEE